MFKRLLKGRTPLTEILLAVLLPAMFLLAPAVRSAAGAGIEAVLPLPGFYRRPSGLQLTLKSDWASSSGYRPMYVTVSSPVPSPADRRLNVTLVPHDWTGMRQGVVFDIKLPEGATSVTKEIAVPQVSVWNQCEITTREDGRRWDDLSVDDSSGGVSLNQAVQQSSFTEAYPSMLFIDSDAPKPARIGSIVAGSSADDQYLLPDILTMTPLFAPAEGYAQGLVQGAVQRQRANGGKKKKRSDDNDILVAVQQLSTVLLLPPDELPIQWINYTCQDLVFVSLSDLQRMSQAVPEKFDALRKYVLGGGNLIVLGAGREFEKLPEIDALLGFDTRQATEDSGTSAESDKESNGGESLESWRTLRDVRYGKSLVNLAAPSNVSQSFNNGRATVIEEDEELDEELDEDLDEELDEEEVEEEDDGKEEEDRDTGEDDTDQEDDDAEDEIDNGDDEDESRSRGQGGQPVPESLFRWRLFGFGRIVALGPPELGDASSLDWAWVLADIGPRHWRWYQRHGLSRRRPNPSFWEFLIPGVGAAPVRMFLVVITAFVFIIGPVNYFLLKRSHRLYLLLVTVPLGAALIISSLFGYALVKDGLGTRSRIRSASIVMPDGNIVTWSRQSYYAGLTPSSGLVYPVDAAVYPIEFDSTWQRNARRLTRWGAVQQMAPGFITARSTSQNLVIHMVQHESPIQLVRSSDDPPQVTNRGSQRVEHVMIRDGDETFWISNLEADAIGQAESINVSAARDRYAKLLNDHRPTTPRGFTAPRNRSGVYRYFYNNLDSGFSQPVFISNLMESVIAQPRASTASVGRLYYAITMETPEFVPTGVEGSSPTAGFHVIRGSW